MIQWEDYAQGAHRISCPECGGRNKSAGLTIGADGTGVMHCFRCGYVETAKRSFKRIVPKLITKPNKHESLSEWGLGFWDKCYPISGTAINYLKARRCVIPPKDSDLRWSPQVKHPSGYVGAALVALVTDIHTGAKLSLHRTWITKTGKADISPVRMPLANHSLENGCIRLWGDEYVTQGLAIGEGIETCLSLAHAYQPVWATIDASHLAKFPVLSGIEVLVIAQDNDAAGIKAASACATRWVGAGREVRITQQSTNDINDVLMEAV
jgi:hypothetical protein